MTSNMIEKETDVALKKLTEETTDASIKDEINELQKKYPPTKNKRAYLDALFKRAVDKFSEIELEGFNDRFIYESNKIKDSVFKLIDHMLDLKPGDLILCDIGAIEYLAYALISNPDGITFGLFPFSDLTQEDEDEFNEFLRLGLCDVADNFDTEYVFAFDSEEQSKRKKNHPFKQVRSDVVGFQDVGDKCFIFYWNDFEQSYPLLDLVHDLDVSSNPSVGAQRTILYCSHFEELNYGFSTSEIWFPEFIDAVGVDSIVEFPFNKNEFLLCWEGRKERTVQMVNLSNNNNSDLVSSYQHCIQDQLLVRNICRSEIYINQYDYTPSRYFKKSGFIHCDEKSLGDLTLEIKRGSSLTKRDLAISGNTNDFFIDPAVNIYAWPGFKILQVPSWAEFLYVDSTCIDNREKTLSSAFVLKKLPANQHRYILYPEDGVTVLIARNGNIAIYRPRYPTLVSGNLFLVRLNDKKINSDYLCHYLRSPQFQRDIHRLSKPLSKGDISELMVPIVSSKVETSELERAQEVKKKIDILYSHINLLNTEYEFFCPTKFD